jgi:hypothetical protein
MPKIIDIVFVSVTNELREKPLMSLEHEIRKMMDKGFKIKGDVLVKVYPSGLIKYIQHLVKYETS